MALNESCRPELDLSRPEELAALYLRVATTLERSAGLADQHAAYLFSKNREQLASVELERAERARTASRRCRDLAARNPITAGRSSAQA